MKTSTKLLILFFASMPVSLLAYNYLLKQEFLKRRFVEHVYPSNSLKVKLPAVNHIVIDGSLLISRDSTHKMVAGHHHFTSTETRISWAPTIQINRSAQTEYTVLKEYQDVVRTKIKNDTLFVSFYKKNGKHTFPAVSLSINTPSIKSIKADGGIYTINGSINKNLELTGLNASITVNHFIANNLTINGNKASFYISRNDRIGKLSYLLKNFSSLQICNGSTKSSRKIYSDSTSTIAVKGNSIEMEKYLVLDKY